MNRRTSLALAAAGLTATLTLAGCSSDPTPRSSSPSPSDGSSASPGSEPQLRAADGYVPKPVGDLAAGFIVITNSGGTADKLTSVTSDLSDDVTIHKTENQKMTKVTSFDIPAGGELNLERGGNHIMFMSLKRQPEEGQKVRVELHFEKTAPMKVDLPVKPINYNPARH
ncbi:copper chaperone PCu(A)C [Streptomyces sp. NPDC004749]